jgi:SAM-dependent methyltransferase
VQCRGVGKSVKRCGDRKGGAVRGYDPAAYGDRLGADYDTIYPALGLETEASIDFLAELAARHPDPSVLEFGIGTGRLAIELNRRGLRVAGIEASKCMVAALRDKAPTAQIDIAIGDYVSTRVPGSFSLVVLTFNNILDPRGRPAQLSIFENAARHLAPGGCFVIDAVVLGRFRRIAASRSVRDAYADPDELDGMAHVHGMTCIARYASWTRAAFTAHSRRHISVYERS